MCICLLFVYKINDMLLERYGKNVRLIHGPLNSAKNLLSQELKTFFISSK